MTVIKLESIDESNKDDVIEYCDEYVERENKMKYRMGLASWRPDWLQKLNSIKLFTLILITFSIVQGVVVNGLVAASIQTIEKEFGFSSSLTGAIIAANDAGALFVVTFVSFFGSKGSKPKWIAVGSLVSGCGAFLFAVPKLLAGRYQLAESNAMREDTCSYNETNERYILDCVDAVSDRELVNAAILIISQIMMGAGVAPLQTLGPTYLDENVSPRDSPIYMGIWLTSVMMGPGLGFVVGSGFLNIYTDLEVPSGSELSARDETWVGAWWLGFVALSGVFITVGGLILLFPKQMKEGVDKREKAIQNGEIPSSDNNIKYTFKGYVVECIKLCFNKVFLLASFALSVETLYHVGLAGFLLKILVLKFGISQVKASAVTGSALLIAMTGGIMAGSFLMRNVKVKIAAKSGALLCAIISFLTIGNACTFLIPGCKTTNLAGVLVSYHNTSLDNSLVSSCNKMCKCSEATYLPVCGSDGITYYSPCYAGCQGRVHSNNSSRIFDKCLCIPTLPEVKNNQNDNILNATDTVAGPSKGEKHQRKSAKSLSNHAVLGKCDRACKNFYLFVVICIFGVIISFLSGTPHKIMVLRCVPDNKRSFALGMQFLILRCFSFLPGPLLIGAVLDAECITWSYDHCGRKKNCLDYDLNALSNKFVLIGTSTAAISSVLYILGWWMYPVNKNDTKPIVSNESENSILI